MLSCDETKVEIEALFGLRSERSKQRESIIRQVDSAHRDFEQSLGIVFVNFPATHQLVSAVAHESLLVAMHFKNKIKRARPWQLAPELAPIIDFPPHASYPSGHATQATAEAMLLARLAPSCREKLTKLAEDIGRNREVAGVHFRSDTKSGERIAIQLMALIVPTKSYQELESRAKNELQGHRMCGQIQNK